VVDDEDTVLSLVRTMLWRAGFTVLEAPGAEEGLRVASEHAGPIDLLISDILMPGANGYELADALTAVRPETKVLFISGETGASSHRKRHWRKVMRFYPNHSHWMRWHAR